MDTIKINDVAKWVNPMNKAEASDIMIVESVEAGGQLLTLRHINVPKGKQVEPSYTFSQNVRIVGTSTPDEKPEDISRKYINK